MLRPNSKHSTTQNVRLNVKMAFFSTMLQECLHSSVTKDTVGRDIRTAVPVLSLSFEPSHEKRDLRFVRLVILQMRMRSHPTGPDL